MLAAYFKEYPAHLAEAARRQAEEANSLLPEMDPTLIQQPSTEPVDPTNPLADESIDPDEAAGSESGRTYTVSDKSDDQQQESRDKLHSPTFKKRDSARSSPIKEYPDTQSPRLSPRDNNDGPLSLNSLDRRSPTKLNDGPSSLGSYPSRPRVKDKCGSLPLDFKEHKRKFPFDFKERSLSLELKNNSRTQSSKMRSTSFDFKSYHQKSPSEIANNYLPDSLKNFINFEMENDVIPMSFDEENSEDSNSSSSDEECLQTFSKTSPTLSGSHLSSAVHVHEPHCKLSSHHPLKSGSQTTTPKKTSVSSSPIPRSTSNSHVHNGGEGCCPVHGSKGHSHSNEGSTHSPVPPGPHKKITMPSLAPSATGSRSSIAENQLPHCGICTKRFKNPKVLPCLHTFCELCLVNYTPPESLTLTCPMCRQQSILPKDGVSGLQANKWLSGIMDTIEPPVQAGNHEQESSSESHSVISLEDSSSQDSSSDRPIGDDVTTPHCAFHKGQTLRFYCRNCETAVCSSCTDIEHSEHSTMRLNDAVNDQRTDLQRLIDKVTLQLPCMKEALCDLTDLGDQLEVNKKEAEMQVRNCFRDLHDLLNERQTDLLNSLNSHVTHKKNAIEKQREELDQWVSGVEMCCEYVEKNVGELPPMEVVLMKKQMGDKLMTFVEAEFPPVPRENAYIQFAVGNIDPLRNAFKHVGRIQTNSAVPQQTTAIGDALKRIYVGRQCVVTVVTRDHKGARIKAGGAVVTAVLTKCVSTTIRNGHHQSNGEIKTSPGSTRSNSRTESVEPQVLDLNNGTYEIFFSVASIGTYTLSVLLFGHHISASPFTIDARMTAEHDTQSEDGSVHKEKLRRQSSKSTQASRKSSSGSNNRPASQKSSCSRRTLKEALEDDLILKIGRKGRGRGEFVNPQGVCYSSVKDGRIVVADSNNQCVQVFNLAGECKIKFGVRGRSVGQLQRPTGVAALPNGQYAIADYENRWVSVFEPTGKYVSRIGHGKLLGPKGMCVNRHGHVIVVDNKASCIFVFHPSGKLITKFGNRIIEGYNFAGPHFCSVNSKGDIIITDFHNHCVRVFTSEGIAKFTFGTNGEGNGQFNAPTGIAVDANDNIIVADWGNSRIQVFDNQGSFLSFVNTLADPLYGPQGLTLTADGNIVVADSGNHCYKVYKYLQ